MPGGLSTDDRAGGGGTSFGWGLAWFFWNLPITIGVLSLVSVALTLADQLASGDGVNLSGVLGGLVLAVPCYSYLGWLTGSGLIAAAWAAGARNRLLVRLLLAGPAVLLAVPARQDGWIAAFIACSGLGLAATLRLPGASRAARPADPAASAG
ncbi:hypothetical protein [Micromonospora auratinigra]|uniref:Uncharacterized protein n=1 Tax=Micromonospora auratinigra TaxID=261654 RepID=A0A1A8ZMH1_9ACTN|nr:hypothetical protein [Micromonospora auratinigra]SBT45066.1 hypothetical protein GA0070611_2899 [Micromonospora auratinigra]